MRYMKCATLALYMSIWAGIVLVGILTETSPMTSTIYTLYTDPITGIYNLIISAFSNPIFLLLALGVGGASALLVGGLTGGGFGILYIIPFTLVFAMMNLFLLPTQMILDPAYPLPDFVRYAYAIFIGTLTILTAMQFTAGRS